MDKYKNRCQIVKRVLANKYGFQNISVKKGKGTARSWTEISINVKKPVNCLGDNPSYCQVCKDTANKIREEAERLAIESGADFGQWYPEVGVEPDYEITTDINFV